MSFAVLFAPEAEDDLAQLFRYLADQSGPDRAALYIDKVIALCEALAMFPERGLRRDDIRPGLRIITLERRTVIAFHVGLEAVTVDRILYGGRDLPTAFGTENP